MPRHATYPPLTVAMNGRRVGELRREPSGAVSFAYGDDWLAWDRAFGISLSLPLREERYAGAPVMAVFDNLLPDEAQVRARLAERVEADGVDAYSLLAAIGRDCVGALQFLPPGEAPEPPGKIRGEPMEAADVAALLEGLAATPLGLDADEDFRISLAGAQEKTALTQVDGRWFRPRGVTPTTHILKPQIGKVPGGVDLSNSVENEWFCMKLVEALGLPVAKVAIGDFAGVRALVVERFDRSWGRDGRLLRLPQEDFCQALGYPPSRKYESHGGPGAPRLFEVLGGSDDPAGDRMRFLKALTVFWLLGATDGHAKNFSLQLFPGGGYALTPLYDVVSVQPLVDAGQLAHRQFKLSMAMGNSRHYAVGSVTPRHLVQTGKAGGLRGRFAIAAVQEVGEATAAAVRAVLDALAPGFPEAIAASIAGAARLRAAAIRRYVEDDSRADWS